MGRQYMRRFMLWRSDILDLEDYHRYIDITSFVRECWDIYLLMGISFLEQDLFDEVIICRLSDITRNDIVFNIGEKKFIQRWFVDPYSVFDFPAPDYTLWRGGFKVYDELMNYNSDFFGRTIYLGASWRTVPQFGASYDTIVVEKEEHLQIAGTRPFYKTANQLIYHPMENQEKIYDLCWIANFKQIKSKGQQYFLEEIAKSKFLRKLKILHIGNKEEIGIEMARNLGIRNIEFIGSQYRRDINKHLNMSKCSICTSNERDGSPRVMTEVICSGTPLILRSKASILDFYIKNFDVHIFDDENLESVVQNALKNCDKKRNNLDIMSIDNIAKMNYNIWIDARGAVSACTSS
jgi:hypothetical protein